MEKKSMGSFLSALRKANGYTQQEVADRLNVSNKTVSKWERDDGCPEIMILPAIADLYGISVDELLRGERRTQDDAGTIPNDRMLESAKFAANRISLKMKNGTIISNIMCIASVIISYTYVLASGFETGWLTMILAFLMIIGTLIYFSSTLNTVLFSIQSQGIGDIIDLSDLLDKIYRQTISFLFVGILTLSSNILFFIFVEGPSIGYYFLSIPAIIAAGTLITRLLSTPLKKLILKDKYVAVKEKRTHIKPELKKKIIIITSIVCCIVLLAVNIVPATILYIKNPPEEYTFPDEETYLEFVNFESPYGFYPEVPEICRNITGNPYYYEGENGTYILKTYDLVTPLNAYGEENILDTQPRLKTFETKEEMLDYINNYCVIIDAEDDPDFFFRQGALAEGDYYYPKDLTIRSTSNSYSLILGFIPVLSDFEHILILNSAGLAIDLIIIAAIYLYCRKKKKA